MKKIITLIMVLSMIASCIPVGFARADMTEYTAFNLWYTPDTYVEKGKTIALTVKDGAGNVLNEENADISFKSLNPAVATVDENGNVKGVNPGIAVISAKLLNNKTELSEEKLAISVINGKVSLQGFETVADAAWPTTMPRTGARSYIASKNVPGSSFSYRSSSGANVDANKNNWGGANRTISSIWFYDDGCSLSSGGSTIFVQNSSAQNILSFRVDKSDYYIRAETAGFNPTITSTDVNNRPARSIGWHQVVFDMSKANMGDGTGERRVYYDGEVIFLQKYTFGAYTGVGQICVQSNYANVTGAMYFDDMNGYGVTRDYKAKAVVTDLNISQKKNIVTGTYNFYDANDSEDKSSYSWQISESESGEYTDIPGANKKSYAVASSDSGKYIRLKVIPNNSTEAVYSNVLLATYSSGVTEYDSFNLWHTPDTHVKKGETIALTVKDEYGTVLTNENAALSFKSLNPAVAAVDENGNVTGVNPGVAGILVQLTNGSTNVLEEKIAITVINGNVSMQSFEAVDDAAWPTAMPRTGARSYIASVNGPASVWSYRNSGGVNVEANRNSWGGANREVASIWFYDDGCSLPNGGSTVFLQNSSAQNILSFRIDKSDYYVRAETAGFNPTITSTTVNNRPARSAGWHQVVFDMTKANMGDGTGERRVYYDGEVIFVQKYTFEAYTRVGQICVQSNYTKVTGALYFDDMNGYGVTRDYNAKPVAADVAVSNAAGFLYGSYSFHDANDDEDNSVAVWQIADSPDGVYSDISADGSKRYKIKPEDEGKYIRLKVTAANAKVTGDSVYSTPVGPVKLNGKKEEKKNTAQLIESSTVRMGTAYTLGRCERIEARNSQKPYKGFLKFDISEIDMEKMKSAVLRMYLIEQDANSIDANITASLVIGDWSENTLNKNNVPEVSQSESVTFRIKRRYAWYEADIYPIIKNAAGDAVSLCITSDSTNGVAHFCGMDSPYPAEIVFNENEYTEKEEYELDSVPATMVDYKIVAAGRAYNHEKYDYKTRLVDNISGYTKANEAPETDIYGGYTDKKFTTTGKFHLEIDDNDRWWLVDPEGNGFISKGVNSVVLGENAEDEDKAFKNKYTSSTPAAEWAQDTKATLIENGFNTLGGWSSRNLFFTNTKAYMPYVTTLSVMGSYMKGKTQPFNGYLPVFDEAFYSYAVAYINENLTETLINDPYMIGITTDNELSPWFTLNNYLSLDEAEYPDAYNAAWEWFRQRHGEDAVIADMTYTDVDDFRGYVFETYYKLMSQTIKERAPEVMYLGSRLNNKAPYTRQIIEAAGEYCDILTINYYGFWTAEQTMLDKWTEWSGRPFIITEFYAKGPAENCDNSSGAGFSVETQGERGEFYQNYTISLLENKNCVGYHWFAYRDETNKNCGIIDRMFNEYSELLADMKEANNNALGIVEHFDGLDNMAEEMHILTPLCVFENDDGGYTYKAVIYNNTDTEGKTFFAIGAYNGNNLMNVKCENLTIPARGYAIYKDSIDADSTQIPRGFIWKSYDSMLPVSEAVEYR